MSTPGCTVCGRDNDNGTHTALEQVGHLAHPYTRPAAIDAEHLQRQRQWSRETFGPGIRRGVVDHIRKELGEVEKSGLTDLEEWVDVIILGFDGALRAGWEPQQIIDAIKAKQAKNEARTWPDWRTMSADEAIEHVREGGAA